MDTVSIQQKGMSTPCFKCKRTNGTISSRDGAAKPYCTDCFTEFCTRAIRDTLFKHCGMPSDEPLAVAVSGGHNSMALLHQLGVMRMQNRLRPAKGHVAFVLCPLHLREDELIVPSPQDSENALSNTMTEQFVKLEAQVRQQCVQWEFASMPLFTSDELRVVRYSDFLSCDEINILRAAFHHPRLPLSDRELLHAKLRQRVLAVAAASCINAYKETQHTQKRGEGSLPPAEGATAWHHLITGDNALRCCVAALREVMTAGGASVVHHSGFRGFVNHCVLMRPLRTMLPREMFLYCRAQNIWAGYTPSLSTGTNLRSMNRTLEAFFNGLMLSYKASIFNVLSTITKLEVETEPQLVCVSLQPINTTNSESGSGSNETVAAAKVKRVIPGKTAQHHFAQLRSHAPPRYVNPQLCVLCGCVIPPADAHLRIEHNHHHHHHNNEQQKEQKQKQQEQEEQEEQRSGVCGACLRCVEGLPKDVAESGALDAFAALGDRLELLMTAADAMETGKEKDGRNVRRRIGDGDDWKSYIIPNDRDSDDGTGEDE